MEIIYRFNAYPPGDNDDEPKYLLTIHVRADSQTQGIEFLRERGFTGIESNGHIAVYNAKK